MRCKGMEEKLVEFLDGRAKPAERHAIEQHLAACADCRVRAEEFRALWSALDDLPAVSSSPSFDATLRARIAAEPAPRRFWDWLPSPRLGFAVTALVVMSIWLSSSGPGVANKQAPLQMPATQTSADAEFGMIQNLPVLENYDVLSKFDALTELPAPAAGQTGVATKENR